MTRNEQGLWSIDVPDAGPGTRYLFRLPNGSERPDPASRHQPDGVHAASALIDPRFAWTDDEWTGIPLRDYVIYELHPGTFTPEGTLDSAARELTRLKELGITAVELMPVAAFPGDRNWGYDGVYPWAVQNSYGGPDAFRRFVDVAHGTGLAVILDVVYNHLGPEGNYLGEFGPYFTDRYRTPWGLALNFDGPGSDAVRDYFIGNALYWLGECHVDALRLDAVHAIVDHTAIPFLQDLARAAHVLGEDEGRPRILIAESDLNDARMIRSEDAGGIGMDAQWSDDFHHAVHVLLTSERSGYYAGYGTLEHIARTLRDGWYYQGDFSDYRGRRYGAPPTGIRPEQLVVSLQNHDQVGNRMHGDRLTATLPDEAVRAGLGLLLLSPFTPMLFMGEEWGERSPFLYFVSHGDEQLLEAVRKGRTEEFRAFEWKGEIPDPGARSTFDESRISRIDDARARQYQAWVKRLIRLRREHPALRSSDLEVSADEGEQTLIVRRSSGSDQLLMVANFSGEARLVRVEGTWTLLGDSRDPEASGGEQVEGELLVGARSLRVLER